MAAMLSKNSPDGTPAALPDTITDTEAMKCNEFPCPFSYTLAYDVSEDRVEDGENVLEVIRRTAHDAITLEHPLHLIETYIWGGLEKGWINKEETKAAGM